MKIQDWRQQSTEEIDLPSGLTVKLKRVSLLDLIGQGQIPTPLVGIAQQFLDGAAGADPKINIADLAGVSGIIGAVVKAAVVEPPIADAPDDEHLALSELPLADQIAIFNWANGTAQQMTSFRDQPSRNGNAAHAGDDVPPAA